MRRAQARGGYRGLTFGHSRGESLKLIGLDWHIAHVATRPLLYLIGRHIHSAIAQRRHWRLGVPRLQRERGQQQGQERRSSSHDDPTHEWMLELETGIAKGDVSVEDDGTTGGSACVRVEPRSQIELEVSRRAGLRR